jgi:hypothetical protein
MEGAMKSLLLGVALAAIVLPAYAGCRLSTSDCAVIAEEMRQAEIAKIVDARNSPPGMSRYERSLWVFDRSMDRLRERVAVLPRRVANEYVRVVYCDTAQRGGATHEARYRRDCR